MIVRYKCGICGKETNDYSEIVGCERECRKACIHEANSRFHSYVNDCGSIRRICSCGTTLGKVDTEVLGSYKSGNLNKEYQELLKNLYNFLRENPKE